MTGSAFGRVGGAGVCPTVRVWIVSSAGVQIGTIGIAEAAPAPDDHFAAGRTPYCRVRASGRGRVDGAGGCPTVGAGIVSAAAVLITTAVIPAPDDHFAAGPDCRVTVSKGRRVGGAGGRPTIRAGIVPPAGI